MGIPNNKLSFNASHLEKTDKPAPKHVSDTQQKPTQTQTTRTEQTHQQPHPQFDEQMKSNIEACMKTHGNLDRGSWKPLSTKWEFGRSKHSGNFAISSKKYQFELDNQNNILILDKENKYIKLTGQHHNNVLSSVLAELENIVMPLIPKIQAQITKYETDIRDNQNDQEKVNIWKDKIGILKEAMTHLRGENIDLDDHARNKFPRSSSGDRVFMTSDTTKLLNEVKEFKPYQPTRQLRR